MRIPGASRAALYRTVATHGYQIVAQPGVELVDDEKRSQRMIGQAPDNALQLRALAARFRAHSAQTCVHLYQRKFEGVASELEEAALDVETRAWARHDLKLVS
jgi:leucyl aminopeptidase (aminopeptidase T)